MALGLALELVETFSPTLTPCQLAGWGGGETHIFATFAPATGVLSTGRTVQCPSSKPLAMEVNGITWCLPVVLKPCLIPDEM